VRFRITRHAGHALGHAPPADALELLLERLGPRRGGVSFVKVASQITATWNPDMSSGATSDERADIGRRAVLDIVRQVAEGDPGLDPDWYAVSELP
jgi:hypothetical protein